MISLFQVLQHTNVWFPALRADQTWVLWHPEKEIPAGQADVVWAGIFFPLSSASRRPRHSLPVKSMPLGAGRFHASCRPIGMDLIRQEFSVTPSKPRPYELCEWAWT
jgi:hypothetical protein